MLKAQKVQKIKLQVWTPLFALVMNTLMMRYRSFTTMIIWLIPKTYTKLEGKLWFETFNHQKMVIHMSPQLFFSEITGMIHINKL